MVCFLKHSEIKELLQMDSAIGAMRQIFTQYAKGETTPTGLLHGTTVDHGEFHIKTGGTREFFAVKVNGGFFQNATKGLPAIQGIILLSDGETGTPLCVLDSGYITGVRTAATSALAASFLIDAPERIGIVGAGKQAQMHVWAMRHSFPNARITMCDPLSPSPKKHVTQYGEAHMASLDEVLTKSNLVITCTPSTSDFVETDAPCVLAVGADSRGKRELRAQTVAGREIVCDIIEQSFAVGEMQYFNRNAFNVRSLGELCLEPRKVSGPSQKFLFDSTGCALQDLAMAKMLYKAAKERGVGTWIQMDG